MPQTSPLTRQQQWLYRHRHSVRVACAVLLVVMIGNAIYNFTEHHIVRGIFSTLICGSPLGFILNIRSLERTATLRDGPGAGP